MNNHFSPFGLANLANQLYHLSSGRAFEILGSLHLRNMQISGRSGLEKEEDFQNAERSFARSLNIYQNTLIESHYKIAEAYVRCGEIYHGKGDAKDAM